MRELLQRIVASKSKTFRAFCFCFLFGVGVASLAPLPGGWGLYLYGTLLVGAALAALLWSRVLWRFVLVCLVFFIFGVWRLAVSAVDCADQRALCHYDQQTLELVGAVAAEPDRRLDRAEYMLGNLSAVAPAAGPENYSGKILLKTKLYPEYHYGDVLKFTCRLERPAPSDDSPWRYDKYLALRSVSAVCSAPKRLAVVGEAPPNRALALLLRGKARLEAHLERLFPEPEASFMGGLLYGSRGTLPSELKESFNKTGLSHIIAISGYNITIIATILMTTLIFLGLWRQQAYWVVLVSLALFVVFTGASASVVRAAVMGVLVLTARQLGRLSHIGNALLLAAAIMALVNPLVLVWDVGFQLSFLATMGLVYGSPILERFGASGVASQGAGQARAFTRAFSSVQEWLREALLPTLSAIIATLPLILYYFGRLSVVAPLVNVMVLWIIPYLMLGGFLALVFSFIFFPLGQLVAWAATLGLKFVIFVATFFAGQSFAAVEAQIPWWGMVAGYGLLGYIWRRASQSKKYPAL